MRGSAKLVKKIEFDNPRAIFYFMTLMPATLKIEVGKQRKFNRICMNDERWKTFKCVMRLISKECPA